MNVEKQKVRKKMMDEILGSDRGLKKMNTR